MCWTGHAGVSKSESQQPLSEACMQDPGAGIGTWGGACLGRGGVSRGPGCSPAPAEPEVSGLWERWGAAGAWWTWLAR